MGERVVSKIARGTENIKSPEMLSLAKALNKELQVIFIRYDCHPFRWI